VQITHADINIGPQTISDWTETGEDRQTKDILIGVGRPSNLSSWTDETAGLPGESAGRESSDFFLTSYFIPKADGSVELISPSPPLVSPRLPECRATVTGRYLLHDHFIRIEAEGYTISDIQGHVRRTIKGQIS
jgi:hypothetical protein